MGLDMYLYRRIYIGNEYRKEDKRVKVVVPDDQTGVMFPTPKDIKMENLHEITEQLGYWRKANAIHKWFIDHCADGVDECQDIYVSREQLEELLDTCKKVKEASQLAPGVVTNGYTSSPEIGGGMQPNLEAGNIVLDTRVAEELLPTTSGFFFGSTDYDQWYMDDIDSTIKILEDALSREDSLGCGYYYRASW